MRSGNAVKETNERSNAVSGETRRRFVIIATGLHNFTGHEYQYTDSVIRRVDRSEYEVQVWGRKDAIHDLATWPEFRGAFSRRAYSQASDGFIRNVWNLVQRERMWFRELQAALWQAKLQPGDVVFVHTFSTYSLWQWVVLQTWFERHCVHLLLVLRYSPVIIALPLRPVYRLLYRGLRRTSRFIHLLTDSQELVDEYQSIAVRPFTVIPIPVETSEYTRDLSAEGKHQIILLYPGSARANKGFHLIPGIVASLNSSALASQVRFRLQVTRSGADAYEPECAAALTRLQELCRQYSNIELIEAHPTPEGFASMIRDATIVLLPYARREYRTQTSGLAAEAIASGKMVIVPANTWLSRQVTEIGWGETFDEATPEALVEATGRAVSRILSGEDIDGQSWSRFRSEHNPERLTEILFGIVR